MAEPTSKPVRLGPGYVWYAALGVTAPTTIPTGSMPTGWFQFGFTEAGSTFGVDQTVNRLFAEEINEPLFTPVTQRIAHLDLGALELDASKFAVLQNADPTIANTTAGGVTTFHPPAVGAEVRHQIAWLSAANDEMILIYQALQTGNTQLNRNKQKMSVVNARFDGEVPAAGGDVWNRMTKDSTFV